MIIVSINIYVYIIMFIWYVIYMLIYTINKK